MCSDGSAWPAVSGYRYGCWQSIGSKRKQNVWRAVRGNWCRWSGYDVWLCNKWDTGVNAISDLPCTQTCFTAYKSAQRRHIKIFKTRRKNTGFCRVWWEWQAKEIRGSCIIHSAWRGCNTGTGPWGYQKICIWSNPSNRISRCRDKILHQPNRPFRDRWTTRWCRSYRT